MYAGAYAFLSLKCLKSIFDYGSKQLLGFVQGLRGLKLVRCRNSQAYGW